MRGILVYNVVVPTMSIARQICEDAAIKLHALQLGEDLEDNEAAAMLREWKRLIDSYGLNRAYVHTRRQVTYPVYVGLDEYTLGYDPSAAEITVTAASNLGLCVLTLDAPHGITVGRQCGVFIQHAEGQWVPINGGQIGTALTDTTLFIRVDSTGFGALTSSQPVTLQIAGTWDFVRPSGWKAFAEANLLWPGTSLTGLGKISDDAYANRGIVDLSGPPREYYPDSDSPFTLVRLYPKPDNNYTLIMYIEKSLEEPVTLDDNITFAQGYERHWVNKLAVECASIFDAEPTVALLRSADEAERLLTAGNRRTPNQATDGGLSKGRYADGKLYFYSGGRL